MKKSIMSACVVCVLSICLFANPFDDVIFHVDFANDSVNDTAGSSWSTGIANDIMFIRVPLMPNGNGIAAMFNGSTSYINYGLGAANELKIERAFTYHIRLRFSDTSNEQFIMGRYDNAPVSFITALKGWPHGHISLGKNHFGGANSGAKCIAGKFYDVFFRFKPKSKKDKGFLLTTVYDTETGRCIGQSIRWPSGYTHIRNSLSKFRIGQSANYDGFCGAVEQINVWNRPLRNKELKTIVTKNIFKHHHDFAPSCNPLYNREATERWQRWLTLQKKFPIVAWGYFQRYKGTLQEYNVYKNANLSMVIAPLSTEQNASKAGLKTLIGHWSDDNKYLKLHYHFDKLKKFVEYGKTHRSVAGYLLSDEAKTIGEFQKLSDAFRYIYKNDPENIPLNTLMSYPFSIGGGFEKYVETYIKMVHPAVLLTTGYMLYADGTTNEDRFYGNFEIIREKALQAKIGYMGFVLNTKHGPYRQASESDLYWQVNSLVAYGAKGIWYYNYRIKPAGSYSDGLVRDSNDKPTRNYCYVKAINNNLHHLWPILKNLHSVNVFHTGYHQPVATRKYYDGCIVGITHLSADNFIISEFRNARSKSFDNDVYVMLVNKRHGANKSINDSDLQSTVAFSLSQPYKYVYKYDSETGKAQKLMPPYKLTFKGGQGMLLKLTRRPN